jgi:hypothetical protein
MNLLEISCPSLVQKNCTGFVPEAKEQVRMASSPTDVLTISNTLSFGGTDAITMGVVNKIDTKHLKNFLILNQEETNSEVLIGSRKRSAFDLT